MFVLMDDYGIFECKKEEMVCFTLNLNDAIRVREDLLRKVRSFPNMVQHEYRKGIICRPLRIFLLLILLFFHVLGALF